MRKKSGTRTDGVMDKWRGFSLWADIAQTRCMSVSFLCLVNTHTHTRLDFKKTKQTRIKKLLFLPSISETNSTSSPVPLPRSLLPRITNHLIHSNHFPLICFVSPKPRSNYTAVPTEQLVVPRTRYISAFYDLLNNNK